LIISETNEKNDYLKKTLFIIVIECLGCWFVWLYVCAM